MAQPASTLNQKDGFQQTSSMNHPAGMLEMKSNVKVDSNGSLIHDDRSYVLLQDKFKSLIQFIGGTITLKATSDLCIAAGQNFWLTVTNDAQFVYGGDKHEYIKGDHSKQFGQQNDKQRKAAKALQKLTSAIDKKKVDTITQHPGEDMICPTCKQKFLTDRAQAITDKAFKTLKKYLPHCSDSLDVFQKYINMLVVPFLSPESNISLNGGKGCGSPGCKNGIVKSKQSSVQAGNDAAMQAYNSSKDEIAAQQKAMGAGGSNVQSFAGDVHVKLGVHNDAPVFSLGEHDTKPFGFLNANGGRGFRYDSKGNCKMVIYSPCMINPGSLFYEVGNKMTLKAGAPGIDILTNGMFDVKAGGICVNATDGEAVLTSQNKTTIKGKNVIIDAKDRSGDSGVLIEADSTMVKGKFNVAGDMALKGSLMMDGGLFVTHITCPGERIPTASSGSSHQVHSTANWNNPILPNGIKYNAFDRAYKAILRNPAWFLTMAILHPSKIQTLAEETYSDACLDMVVDNAFLPTGYAMVLDYFTQTPLAVETDFGPGIVIPARIPIYNYTHNHGSPGDDHTHDYTAHVGHNHGNATASRAARPDPSHVPTPAKPTGMGAKPGHKTMGDLGSCGGGGAFGRVNKATSARNANYGINGNPYNGNYVDAVAEFNPDGSLKVTPKFSLGC
jgi:hypothetical protein